MPASYSNLISYDPNIDLLLTGCWQMFQQQLKACFGAAVQDSTGAVSWTGLSQTGKDHDSKRRYKTSCMAEWQSVQTDFGAVHTEVEYLIRESK